MNCPSQCFSQTHANISFIWHQIEGVKLPPGHAMTSPMCVEHASCVLALSPSLWQCLSEKAQGKRVFALTLTFSYWDSVQFSHSVMSDSLQPHEPQYTMPPCPSPTPGVHPNPCPLSQWCHSTISSSVIPFSSCPQSFPESGSFQMSQLFPSGGQSIGVSASTLVLPMNTQDWSPLGGTGWISFQSTGLPRVFSNTTIQKHQFFGAQLSL